MSFTSTYNSLSARAWSAGAGAGYAQTFIETGTTTGFTVILSNDGNYLMASNAAGGIGDELQVYKVNNGQLALQQALIGNLSGAGLGQSMDTNSDGSYLVAGMPFYAANDLGAIRIYTRSGNTWSFQQDIYGNVAFRFFGSTVAIDNSADRIVTNSTNAVYIYNRSGTTWSLEQSISIATGVEKVDINGSGDTIVIGCPTVSSQTGDVKIYTRSGNTWSSLTTLTGSNTAPGDKFGYNVVINTAGNIIVASAPEQPIGSNTMVGSAYIFANSGSWSEVDNIQPFVIEDNALFGQLPYQMSISDNNIISIGASANTINTEGTIYNYAGNGTQWQIIQQLIHSNTIPSFEFFGFTVALSGDGTYLASSFGNNTPEGNIVLFSN